MAVSADEIAEMSYAFWGSCMHERNLRSKRWEDKYEIMVVHIGGTQVGGILQV